MEEVASGMLEGPIALEDIPSDHPLSRRFGIRQGAEVRRIDDFSGSSVNSCVQTRESPKPHTIDVFAAMCVHLMSAISSDAPWVGRTFDLVGAYRQCAVKPSSRKYAYIIVQRPDTMELVGFRMKALPFGSVRSVHAFLRISHSLWFVLVKELKVLLTNYLDDFVAASPDSECNSITSCVHMYFKLLGWAFSESGDKAHPFGNMFHALGVAIDVSTLHTGLVKELIEFLDMVIARGHMTKQEALRLRGRLQFTSGSVFGRVDKFSLAAISNHAYSSKGTLLSGDAILAMKLHSCLLRDGRPRELKPSSAASWFIQTDACYDADGANVTAGVGAVLFNPAGRPILFFSQKLPDEMVSVLNPSGKQTAIFEREFFALFCAFSLWGERVTNAGVIYTDNNGVRDSLISCVSRNVTTRKILIATMALECICQLTPWYARIPTDFNLSDGPSRFCCQKVLSMGAEECFLDVSTSWDKLVALYESWGEKQATEQPQLWKRRCSVVHSISSLRNSWQWVQCLALQSCFWPSSAWKGDNVAVKHDSDLSPHARCGRTSAAWFKRLFGNVCYNFMSIFNAVHVTSSSLHSTMSCWLWSIMFSFLGELQTAPPSATLGSLQLTVGLCNLCQTHLVSALTHPMPSLETPSVVCLRLNIRRRVAGWPNPAAWKTGHRATPALKKAMQCCAQHFISVQLLTVSTMFGIAFMFLAQQRLERW